MSLEQSNEFTLGYRVMGSQFADINVGCLQEVSKTVSELVIYSLAEIATVYMLLYVTRHPDNVLDTVPVDP